LLLFGPTPLSARGGGNGGRKENLLLPREILLRFVSLVVGDSSILHQKINENGNIL
jgi:hypothetical protein